MTNPPGACVFVCPCVRAPVGDARGALHALASPAAPDGGALLPHAAAGASQARDRARDRRQAPYLRRAARQRRARLPAPRTRALALRQVRRRRRRRPPAPPCGQRGRGQRGGEGRVTRGGRSEPEAGPKPGLACRGAGSPRLDWPGQGDLPVSLGRTGSGCL